MISLTLNHREIICSSDISQRHISQGIIIRIIISLRAIKPLRPSSEVSVIEGYSVIIQEVRSSASSGRSERSFSNNCISFNEIHFRIQNRYQNIPHLAENTVERLLEIGHSELHLSDVA